MEYLNPNEQIIFDRLVKAKYSAESIQFKSSWPEHPDNKRYLRIGYWDSIDENLLAKLNAELSILNELKLVEILDEGDDDTHDKYLYKFIPNIK